MKAGTKLAIYGAGLLAMFGAAYGLAGVVVPESVVTSWMEQADGHDAPDHGTGGHGETEEQP
jgi:hypothetical protein